MLAVRYFFFLIFFFSNLYCTYTFFNLGRDKTNLQLDRVLVFFFCLFDSFIFCVSLFVVCLCPLTILLALGFSQDLIIKLRLSYLIIIISRSTTLYSSEKSFSESTQSTILSSSLNSFILIQTQWIRIARSIKSKLMERSIV